MAKNPANRYQSAAAMRRDLVNALSGGPVAAPAVLDPSETAILDPVVASGSASLAEVRRRRNRTYIVLAILSFAAAALGVWYVVSLISGPSAENIEVPNLIGRTLSEAQTILDERGLDLFVVGEIHSDTVEPGRIAGQEPAPGRRVAEGDLILLRTSRGPETALVPDVFGLPESEAIQALRDAGLVPANRRQEFDEDVEAGHVISTSPAQGTAVTKGSRIDYVVSAGQELERVLPVVGLTEGDAVFQLEDQGFEVLIVREFDENVAPGFVIRQSPGPGTELEKGAEVTIVVSEGSQQPSPSPSPTGGGPGNGNGNGGGNGGGNDGLFGN
jgi:serine/threonine-protein kinase